MIGEAENCFGFIGRTARCVNSIVYAQQQSQTFAAKHIIKSLFFTPFSNFYARQHAIRIVRVGIVRRNNRPIA